MTHASPYAVSREPVYAQSGMVSTSQPLASQAGLFILREGGNAVDAAVATAAALAVVEPTSNGIGGDAFALVHVDNQVYGLNGSGCAPLRISSQELSEVCPNATIPLKGWAPVTVPGAPKAWADLHQRFGKLPFEKIMAPAIDYARKGYPLSPVLARDWKSVASQSENYQGAVFQPWKDVFAPRGFKPEAGVVWRSEDQAITLETIARSKAEDFYTGSIASKIDQFSRDTGGWIRLEDMATHESIWVDPIYVNYKGYEVWEVPPNSQAISTLQALKILKGIDLPGERDTAESLHYQIEALKLGFADTLAFVGDPKTSAHSLDVLLSDKYLNERRNLISETAMLAEAGTPSRGNTVYLCAADKEGMMVSFIQSNYEDFGSGVVIPDTGIALQNRGANFTLEKGHPNEIRPGKRPYHTLMPGFLTKQGKAVGPFGVMGGFMQPAGHLQVIVNTIDYKMNPQAALDAPRWMWSKEREISVEQRVGNHIIRDLLSRGHEVSIELDPLEFGRGQAIWKKPNNVLIAGSESRTDGCAVGY